MRENEFNGEGRGDAEIKTGGQRRNCINLGGKVIGNLIGRERERRGFKLGVRGAELRE